MAQPETHSWTVFLDGRSYQVVIELEYSIRSGLSHRVLVNANVATTGQTSLWGVKFKIGSHKCKITISWGAFGRNKADTLLIDDRDASEFAPPSHYSPPEPQAASKRSVTQERELDAALDGLQDRLIRGEISENIYGELKARVVARSERGEPLVSVPVDPRGHSEKVIERQVLVTRCRFCKKLTPFDLTECASCGATL